MKLNKYITSASLALVSISSINAATTIAPANAVGGSAGFVQQVLIDTIPYTGGTFKVGTFATTSGLSGEGPINLSDFGWSIFGEQSFSSSPIAPGVFGAFVAAGQTATITGDLPTTATGPFIGNNIFVLVENTDSSEFIIWDSGQQFQVEDALLGGAKVSVLTEDSTLLRGAVVVGGNTGLGGPLAVFNGRDAVTFVPEPSSALLACVGALFLVRRKR